ncbi:MAG: SurA N-terminal domain-containing protein [Syntrophobacterales bacterium]|nr:SurA N-terminal domain-containing protein [Syntrophobacterales bacterium]
MTGMMARWGFYGMVLVLAAVWAAPTGAEVVDRIVAVVNDEVISQSELEMMIKSLQFRPGMESKAQDKAFQREILEALIDQKLANAEAKRRGLSVSDKELEAALEDFKQQNRLKDDAALQEALGKAHMTLSELKERIRGQILQDRLMAVVLGPNLPSVSESEVRRIYETEVPKEKGTRVHLKVLTLPAGASPEQQEEARKKAEALLREHKEGADLETLSRRHGLSLQDLGAMAEDDLAPQLAGFLRKLQPRQVGVVQSPQGLQLVELVSRRTGSETRSYEEMAPRIRQALQRQEMGKRFGEYLKTLRQKAHIKIML